MPPPRRIFNRFWFYVNRGADCWMWEGYASLYGYGQFWNGEKSVSAHRFCYEMMYGPIPDGLIVRHRCGNPGCVRPTHLELGTIQDNILDSVHRSRRPKKKRYWKGVSPWMGPPRGVGRGFGCSRIEPTTDTGIMIIKFREKMLWSQSKLAEAVGVSRTTIANWEAGPSLPSMQNYKKLKDLGVEVP